MNHKIVKFQKRKKKRLLLMPQPLFGPKSMWVDFGVLQDSRIPEIREGPKIDQNRNRLKMLLWCPPQPLFPDIAVVATAATFPR